MTPHLGGSNNVGYLFGLIATIEASKKRKS
jgi:hypothetical protein